MWCKGMLVLRPHRRLPPKLAVRRQQHVVQGDLGAAHALQPSLGLAALQDLILPPSGFPSGTLPASGPRSCSGCDPPPKFIGGRNRARAHQSDSTGGDARHAVIELADGTDDGIRRAVT